MPLQPMVSPILVSFSDELIKIAEMTPEDAHRERMKNYLLGAGVASLGTGIGYGAGSAIGRSLGWKAPQLGRNRLLMGGLGAAAGLGGLLLADSRRAYERPNHLPRPA